jgi:hypothetical protein
MLPPNVIPLRLLRVLVFSAALAGVGAVRTDRSCHRSSPKRPLVGGWDAQLILTDTWARSLSRPSAF